MKKHRVLISGIILLFGVIGAGVLSYAAEITYLEGNVQVQSPKDNLWKTAEKGMKVDIGDSIRTARHSLADVVLDEAKKNSIRIDPSTLVVLNSSTPGVVDRLDLSRGKVLSNLEGLKSGLSFEVNTPSAVCGVRGSSYSVYVERDTDEVTAFKDTVFLKTYDASGNELPEVMLPEGFKTLIERFEMPGALIQISNREFERFDDIREDLSSRNEGRENVRAQREAERRQKEQESQQEKQTIEQKADQAADQGGVINEVNNTKTDVEDHNTATQIEEFREKSSESQHPW